MDLDDRYPALGDLAARARRRLPRFVWEYLDSATGLERARDANAEALDGIELVTRVLDPGAADLTTPLLGRDWALPVGVAPVGMSGLVWPEAEDMLARAAGRAGAPYCLSTVAARTPEEVGPSATHGWFQLYPPRDEGIRRDMLARARDAGFEVLILTADVATASRRERLRRSGVTNPMRITPKTVWEAALAPEWSLATVRSGIPGLAMLQKYADQTEAGGSTSHIGYQLRVAPDMAYLEALRREWDGPLVVKGVLSAEDARRVAPVADAVWVSNHGGRQFDGSTPAARVLPAIREAVPDMPLIADGGVRNGTDMLRYLALGADFVMLGRAFHHGIAALGEAGADHVFHILREGLLADMGQLAITRPVEVRGRIA